MINDSMAAAWRRWSRLGSLAGCLAMALASCNAVARRPAPPAYSYEVVAVGNYRQPLPEEFGRVIAALEPQEVLVVKPGPEGFPQVQGVTADPELYRRVAHWNLGTCIGVQSGAGVGMCYLVIRTGDRNFKEVRIPTPDLLAGNPVEDAAPRHV